MNLEPGIYTLTLEANGFKTLKRPSITLAASERLVVLNLTMQVGTVDQSVTVTSQSEGVQTRSAERGAVITGKQMDSLLIQSRSLYHMLALVPGMQDEREEDQPSNAWNLSALGDRQTMTNISLDSVSINNMIENSSSNVDVSMDSVAEVKVLIGVFQAEYGRMSGANVQVVTKSGTRDFHGLGAYFLRNEALNANNFFSNRSNMQRPKYRFENWNYNVGGPVVLPGTGFNRHRDKLFFFWSQEHWPTTTSSVRRYTMPTQLERNGDFSQSVDLNNKMVTVYAPLTGLPLPGNKMPANQINKSGQALLNMFPQPNFLNRDISGGSYNWQSEAYTVRHYWTQTLKVDWNPTAQDSVSTNFSFRKDPVNGYYGQGHYTSNTWPQMAVDQPNTGFILSTRYNKIFSPTLVNEFTLGIRRQLVRTTATPQALEANQRDAVGFTARQINPDANPLNLVPDATFGGISSAAPLSIDFRFPEILSFPSISLSDNLTKVYNTHTIKAGIVADYLSSDETGYDYYRGRFDFGTNALNPLDTKYAYANAMFGVYNSYTEDSKFLHYVTHIKQVEWFLQETWRVSKRLTLDYGMRFHWMPFPSEANGLISGFEPALWSASNTPKLIGPAMVGGKRVGQSPLTGSVYPAVAIGALAPGSGDPFNGVVTGTDPGYKDGLVRSRGIMFGPRFGFAIDVFGNGRTAIRGGGGILYQQDKGYDAVRVFTNQAPQVTTRTLYYGNLEDVSSAQGLMFPVNILGLDRGAKMPTVYNTSFTIQQNVGFGTIVDVGYVGSLGRHLEWNHQLNDVPLGANWLAVNKDPTKPSTTLSTNFLRPRIGYGSVGMFEWNASSSYHSLQVMVNRRLSQRLQYGVSWTWSKAMDIGANNTSISDLVGFRWAYYGLSPTDRTHNLKGSFVWTLPNGSRRLGDHRPVKWVTDGWQVSGIATMISGAPTSVGWSSVVSQDITGSPSAGARVVLLGNPVLPKSERSFSQNFRTDVFAPPVMGTLGTAPRNYLRGPGRNNWDLALFKDFRLGNESRKIQLRWEAYNVFNHTQFRSFNNSARFDQQGNQINAQLSQYTGAYSPRIMQGSLK
jgi:hypothetical protein